MPTTANPPASSGGRFVTRMVPRLRGVMLLATLTVATSLAYRLIHPEWVAFHRGESAAQAGDLAAAESEYRNAVELGLDKPAVDIRLARIALEQDDPEAARSPVTRILSIDPAHTEAAQILAGIDQHNQDATSALHVLLDARDAGATFPPAADLQLADLYRQAQLYPDAAALYRTLANDPDVGAKATLHLAQMLAWQKEYTKSLQLLRQLVTDHPDNRNYRLHLARILGWSGETEAAIAEYQRLLKP